jgi:serine/threonine kinase 3
MLIQVVQFYGSYLKDREFWIIMEFCACGSISDLMRLCNTCLSEDQISHICYNVLKGLEYLHSQRKIHRDIKAGNVLLTANGDAKLADFGVGNDILLSRAIIRKLFKAGDRRWDSLLDG